MLATLNIENIAVIEKANIDFSDGFICLTGETGAGKSIIIDSINAVMGEKTSRELIRTGAETAMVSALFTNIPKDTADLLAEMGLPAEDDGSLLIQRIIKKNAGNICRINGAAATLSMLKSISATLIAVHGQSDSRELMAPENHIKYIDRLANNDELLKEYAEVYNRIRSVKREIERISADESEKARRLDILSFQIDELKNANIRAGEMDELKAQRDLFQNSQSIIENLSAAYEALSGSEYIRGAAELSGDAASRVESVSQNAPQLKKIGELIREASITLSECATDISEFIDSLNFDPALLDSIEKRLDELFRLSRKYGETEEEMLAFLHNAEKEREEIELSEERLNALYEEIGKLKEELISAAEKLTESRRKTAEVFEQRVKEELKFLDMPYVQFKVDIQKSAYKADGADKIEFLLSANPGEEPKPLIKTASGGELSRIMLAIKCVLSDADTIGTLIFDEIDTGVSGRAAGKVAIKLKETAKSRQVICVTHLSQLACMADSHLLIEKTVSGGSTFTSVRELDFEGRKREIARINGGMNITPALLKSAEEMLIAAGIAPTHGS
ncbi:MAG TPA: DNA repair protein RecN [Clostridiales bacterium]|nr:DNA repair protein RecN [Clostridiales bacterium]HXK83807.1 DNA repair protein RecN [Clostridiales bacterium]